MTSFGVFFTKGERGVVCWLLVNATALIIRQCTQIQLYKSAPDCVKPQSAAQTAPNQEPRYSYYYYSKTADLVNITYRIQHNYTRAVY